MLGQNDLGDLLGSQGMGLQQGAWLNYQQAALRQGQQMANMTSLAGRGYHPPPLTLKEELTITVNDYLKDWDK